MKKHFEANKPTGASRMDGSPEIGNRCQHSHRSFEAAEKCARKQGDRYRAVEIKK